MDAAVDAAAPGDTVTVRPGTYAGDVVVDVADLTFAGDGDAVVSVAADGVTVAGLRVENPGGLLGIKARAGLSGVTIRENRVSNVGPFGRLGVSGIIAAAGQDDLAVVGNSLSGLREEASGVAAQGIFLDDQSGTSADVRIAGNEVSDVRTNFGAIGILLQVAGATVENNRVRGLRGIFAQGANFDGSAGDIRLAGNTFEDVSGSQFPGEGIKIDGGDVSAFTITANVLLAPVGIKNDTSEKVTVGAVDYTPWNVGRIGSGNGNTCRGGQ
ncbi:hypothetical protein BRC83_02070 [Halobacteriales archaeon QS_1_68_17]|nr:MAG: hypothetical protein BRC83_02070 [Halobacteriales archaeon QS_1_68_17]